MPLTAGTRMGPFEIKGPLGAGGMGEVYRARDPRLSRDVAIKILPEAFAADAERLRRFEFEARAAGSLNHPNILAVFDVGTHDGAPYLVTELLEGESLRTRLRSNPLPLRKAIDYAVQIARGLAAAHAKSIVHRDLKPDNIFLCSDGQVKILDFGLARSSAMSSENSATKTLGDEHDTKPGMVLGTAGYMSPEQVRGLPVDARSDIFSFGAVLYEMVSGRRAFAGDSQADIASAILKEDPPDLSGAAMAPPALARITHHCMEKEPNARFQSARDLAFQLENISLVESSIGKAEAETRAARPWSKIVLPLLLVAALLGGWWWYRTSRPAEAPAVAYQRLTDFAGLEESPAFSPDGRSIAFTADVTGSRQIWVRLLAGGAPLQITHNAGDHLYPRWSRDSAVIFYYQPPTGGEITGSLWQVAALGGSPRQLSRSLSGADVSHDGKSLAFFRLADKQVELVKTDLDGSNSQNIAVLPIGFSYRQPRWSPKDDLIAYEHNTSIWSFDIYVVAAAGGAPRQVTQDHPLMNGFAWTPDGIVYSSAQGNSILYLPTMQLWITSLDGKHNRQLTYGEASYEDPDVDKDGRIVASRRYIHFDIWKYPVGGAPAENVRQGVRITHQTAKIQVPTLSPDNKEMAFLSDSGGHGNVWVMNLSSGETRQITAVKADLIVGVPIWSPDGTSIAFAITKPGNFFVAYWMVNPDGSNLRTAVRDGSWASWSGDGKWLYYTSGSPTRKTETEQLYKVRAEGGDPVLVRTDEEIRAPAPAPDGSGVYYLVPLQSVNGALDYDVKVARPENGTAQRLVRVSGNRVPIWQGLHPTISPDDQWMALPLNDNFGTNLWLVSTRTGAMRQITDFGDRRTYIVRRVAWSADGKFIYTALGEGDADIVTMEGLLH